MQNSPKEKLVLLYTTIEDGEDYAFHTGDDGDNGDRLLGKP